MVASTLVDLVKVYAVSGGTDALTLGQAVPGYRGVEALTNGAVYSYSIQQGAEYEVGQVTYLLDGHLLVRSPTLSSDGGTAINLQAGTEVAFTALVKDLKTKGDPGGNIFAIGTFDQANGMDIPAGTNRVRTSGYSIPGVGAADYVYNPQTAVPITRGANQVPNPNDLTGSPWVPMGAGGDGVITTATYDGTYTTITDAGNGYCRWEAPFAAIAPYMTVEARIKKDAVPAATRKAVLRVRLVGGTVAKQCDVLIDTMEGTVFPGDKASTSTAAAFNSGIIDDGTDWRVWVTVKNDVGATSSMIRIYPANGPGNSSASTATGSVSLRNVQLYTGVSDQYVPSDNPRTFFTAADVRVFRLALDQVITHQQLGTGVGGFDDAAWSAFNDFVSYTDCPSVNWGGSIRLASPDAAFGPASSVIATGAITGALKIMVAAGSKYGLVMRNIYGLNWSSATVEVLLGGGQDISTRTVLIGVEYKGNCGRSVGGRIRADNPLFAGFRATSKTGDNFNFATVAEVSANNAGSGSGNANSVGSVFTSYTYDSSVDSEGFDQRSVIVADKIWPAAIDDIITIADDPFQVLIGTDTYYVVSFTRAGEGGTLRLRARLPAAARVPGAVSNCLLVWGGTVYTRGGNSKMTIGVGDSAGSGRTAMLGALHGTTLIGLNNSFNGQGILVGRNMDGATYNNVVISPYFEENTCREEIAILSRFAHLEVLEGHQTNPDRWADLTKLRRDDDGWAPQSGSEGGFRYVAIHRDGKRYEWKRRGLLYARPTSVTLTSVFQQYQDIGDTLTINLSAADASTAKLMGYNGGVVRRLGTGTNAAPTSSLVINAPAGGTVNGGSSASIAGKEVIILTADAANLVWLAGASA